jgi:hypothetical protein
MKRFIVDKRLYYIVPLGIILVAGTYMAVIFKRSTLYSNIINLIIDGLLLLMYFLKFCTAVGIDSEGINFYTIFKKKRVIKSEIEGAKQSSFLTRFTTVKGSFYVLTTIKGGNKLQEMFKDF